ncbi:MAG: long-chain-fatty-acid--CoA ligase [Thermoprotei archaeon]|nr:long-chain-fatty-acid--CoA ligase [Thermoprotei archaeon]
MKLPWRPGYDLTLDKIIKSALQYNPEGEIVYRTRAAIERYNYSTAFKRMNSLAAALSSLGVREGDRVATLDWNTHWHYETYFAVPMMGAVLHTVNVRLAPYEVEYIMNHAEDKVAIVHADFLKLVEYAAPRVKSLEHVIVVDADSAPEKLGNAKVHLYEDLIKSYRESYEWPELSENTVAAMCYTSGTTGLPKGAYYTHRQMVIHALSTGLFISSSPLIGLNSAATVLHIVPMFHAFAWSLPYVTTLIGVKQVYPNRLIPSVLLELIAGEKVTHTAGVPTILYMLLTDPSSVKYDLRGLKFLNGGSAIPEGLAELARRRGIEVIVGYGLTETGPVLTLASPPAKLLTSPELGKLTLRTGWPIFLVELRVVDSEGKPMPRDGRTMGEIVARSPWLISEYYKDPAKTEELWRGGWLNTGDIAVWFEDGSILIMDRAKDMIKSGGEWISSVRLEDAISTHPGIAQVAVIAAKSRKWGERPAAFIVPKPEWKGKITLDEIRRHLEENYVAKGLIPRWWLPDKVVEVESLPLTSVGKIAKRVLREQYKDLEVD